jgi:uncharacterized protein
MNSPNFSIPPEFTKKISKVQAIIEEKHILVAYSGGIDSTLMCYFAKRFGKQVLAVLIHSPLTPRAEIINAQQFAKNLNIPLRIEVVNSLDNPDIMSNRTDRCYYCKKSILIRLETIARENGLDLVCDGTNYSDLSTIRAGLKALKESHVRSPLAEAGITKEDIRQLTLAFKLPSYNIPSQACLASRVPFNIPLSEEILLMIDEAENFIRKITNDFVSPLRVRIHPLTTADESFKKSKSSIFLARIEAEEPLFHKLFEESIRTTVSEQLCALGFGYVTVNLAGFISGSMDILINK